MSTWNNSHQWLLDTHDSYNAYESCKQIYEELLLDLTYELNVYHSINWSCQQYRKLLGNWLFNFVQIVHYRWLGCTPEMTTIDDSSMYLATNSLDVIHTYGISDLANRSLYHQLANLKFDSSFKKYDLPSSIDCPNGFDLIGDTTASICINEPFHSYGRFGWRYLLPRRSFPNQLTSFSSPIKFQTRPLQSTEIDKAWRLASIRSSSDSFRDACSQLMRLHLPLVYLEGFCSILDSVRSVNVKSLFTAVSMNYNIPFKFIAANLDKTCPIFVHQHGANYGTDRFCMTEDYERSVSKRFYTWGWKEDKITEPLPAPARLQSWRISSSRRILLTCANRAPFLTRYYCHESGMHNRALIERTIRLLKKLKHLDIEISYYRHDFDWNVRDRFDKAEARVPEKSTQTEHYGLHIINYIGTAWMESMAANLPTICFVDPKMYLFRKACIPYIEALTSVGILHESVDSAVDLVLEIQQDPQRWWSQDEVQDARQAFVERYARLEDSWLENWVDEFGKIAEMVESGEFLD